jgi:hypothetical protein
MIVNARTCHSERSGAEPKKRDISHCAEQSEGELENSERSLHSGRDDKGVRRSQPPLLRGDMTRNSRSGDKAGCERTIQPYAE